MAFFVPPAQAIIHKVRLICKSWRLLGTQAVWHSFNQILLTDKKFWSQIVLIFFTKYRPDVFFTFFTKYHPDLFPTRSWTFSTNSGYTRSWYLETYFEVYEYGHHDQDHDDYDGLLQTFEYHAGSEYWSFGVGSQYCLSSSGSPWCQSVRWY